MKQNQITVSRKLVYTAAIGLVALIVLLLSVGKFSAFDFGRSSNEASNNASVVIPQLVAGSQEKFDYLSGHGQPRSVPSSCGLQPPSVEAMPDDARIQGACCSAMDLHKYQEQVEGLKKYTDVPQIPADPYDVPVSLAKQLFEYQRTIQLTADQQTVYDQAMQMADEKGPCCCHCWRWIAFEGQAKYLISQLHWSAEEIATVWDLEDGCGGAGHEHGEGM